MSPHHVIHEHICKQNKTPDWLSKCKCQKLNIDIIFLTMLVAQSHQSQNPCPLFFIYIKNSDIIKSKHSNPRKLIKYILTLYSINTRVVFTSPAADDI